MAWYRYKELIISVMSLLCCHCQSAVDIEFDNEPPRLVINTLFEAGCDSILLQVSVTKQVNDFSNWKAVRQAVLRLFENGQLMNETFHDSLKDYILYHKVRGGCCYRIEVETADYGLVWGETRVPREIVDYKIDIGTLSGGNSRYKVDCQWQDSPEESNFYWIGAGRRYSAGGMYNESLLYSNSSLIDPFNRISDEVDGISTCYEYYIRVEETGINGQLLRVPFQVSGGGLEFCVFLLAADEHYDAYLKSSIINKINQDMIEDLPLFDQPAYTYSNIHNGVGLVGSFVRLENKWIRDE